MLTRTYVSTYAYFTFNLITKLLRFIHSIYIHSLTAIVYTMAKREILILTFLQVFRQIRQSSGSKIFMLFRSGLMGPFIAVPPTTMHK